MEVLKINAHTIKKLITYLLAHSVTGESPSIARQEINTPSEIKIVGRRIDTMAPRDRKVEVNFLKNTALNCRVHEYEHS